MKTRVFVGLAALAVIVFAPPSAFAACCSLNGGPCNIIPPLVHGTSPWTGSVCGTTISGTNCDARLDTTDGSLSSGDCITLGAGVSFDLNGRTLTCTDALCGNAISNTSSGGSSAAVTISNGRIIGCWGNGITAGGGTNASASDLLIDKLGSCSLGTHGITGLPGTIDHVVIANAEGVGISLAIGQDVKNTKIRNSATGIAMFGTVTSSTDFDNVMLVDNGTHIYNAYANAVLPDTQRSELHGATTCNCEDGSGCVDVDTCVDFINSTTPNFVDDSIVP